MAEKIHLFNPLNPIYTYLKKSVSMDLNWIKSVFISITAVIRDITAVASVRFNIKRANPVGSVRSV